MRLPSLVCYLIIAAAVCGCGVRDPFALELHNMPHAVQGHGFPYDLRVMSFNVRQETIIDLFNSWGRRKDIVAMTVENFDADIIGTQELESQQEEDLTKMLPAYAFVGVGRDNGRRKGEMCGIYFKKDKFRVLAEGHFWLSDDPYKPGSKSWGSNYPRLVTIVQLQPTRLNSYPFYVLNTHLDHSSGSARDKGAKLLRTIMNEVANGDPAIIMGDFNDGEGSRPYRNLTTTKPPTSRQYKYQWTSLADTYREVHPDREKKSEGTHHGFWGGKGGKRIDWILTTPQFQILDAKINRTAEDKKYPSDHFPVSAVLRFHP